jgi:hypothetical protein
VLSANGDQLVSGSWALRLQGAPDLTIAPE